MFRISALSKSRDLCEVQVLLRVNTVIRLFCCTGIPMLRVEKRGMRAVTTHLSADGRCICSTPRIEQIHVEVCVGYHTRWIHGKQTSQSFIELEIETNYLTCKGVRPCHACLQVRVQIRKPVVMQCWQRLCSE